MHSLIYNFCFFSLIIIFLNPKEICPLQLSFSSDTRFFNLHSLPHGYLTFLGDSHLGYDAIILTKEGMRTDAPKSAGVVLYSQPILFLDPHSKKVASFYTRFAFSIQNLHGGDKAFGDGLAFLISSDNDLLGSPGYLGLVDSTGVTRNRFIAIEFDTKYDTKFHDPDDNHLGLDINSLLSAKLATSSSLGVKFKGGDLITAWIDYQSNEKRLEVFVSDIAMKPKKPQLKVDIDLSDYLNENMFVGFSAAQEESMQLTRIQQWEFKITEFSPPPPPSPLESGYFPNPPDSGHKHSHLSRFAVSITVGVCSLLFLVVFGGFCWKKLRGVIQKLEVTNNLEMQTIKSSGGISRQEIQLSVLLDEVAKGLNVHKVLDNKVELIYVKTMKCSIPFSNSLPAVKPSITPLCSGYPPRTNDVTSV